ELTFFFSSRRRHTRSYGDWSSDVCSSDLARPSIELKPAGGKPVSKQTIPSLTDFSGSTLEAKNGITTAWYCRSEHTPRRLEEGKIGRASCRERVEISEGGGRVEEKKRS